MKGQESNSGEAKHSTGETWRAGLPQCCLWPRVRQLAFHNPTLLSRSLKPTPEGCKALQVLPAAESHEIKKKKKWAKDLDRPLTKKDVQMANKQMKKCPTQCATREMQIKLRYHYIPIRIAKIQDPDNTKCWWECGTTGILIH